MKKDTTSCKEYEDCKVEYSALHVWIDNIPYIVMVLLGAVIIYIVQNALLASLFVVYGIVGTLWFIVFICPFCHYYGSKACPCGYGTLSAKVMKKKDDSKFNKVFKRNVIAIVPLWFLPIAAGVYGMVKSFSVSMLILVVIFIVDSCVILPWVSRKYGCVNCPNKEECFWMAGKKSKGSK
ncbi:MAG: hypothetical protein A2044_07080 [Candidatus Firestonebacteria bacterium GWA2_43_8]|nr:MAG: hypothetical protein A2044_07080 [Candidatus Firestonebacteria bacterium GWA2_43_8]